MKNDKSYRITISAVGACLSLFAVILAYYVRNLSISLNVLASIGLMMPMSQKFYKESFLAYLSVCIIGAIIVNIQILAFIFLGGMFPLIVIFLFDYKIKRYLRYIIYFVFSLASFAVLYYVFTAISINLFEIFKIKNAILIYITGNLIFFIALLIYELIIIMLFKEMLRILARINKA